MSASAAERLSDVIAELDVPASPGPDGGWVIDVPCEARGIIPVLLVARERTIALRGFVMRAPDRNHDAVYRRALRKNFDLAGWRFAVDELGDLFLAADIAVDGCDANAVDGLLGAAAGYVDDIFEGLVRTGFAMPDGWSSRGGPAS